MHENNHCWVIYSNNKTPWKHPYLQQKQNYVNSTNVKT